jgi:hypothetical protein
MRAKRAWAAGAALLLVMGQASVASGQSEPGDLAPPAEVVRTVGSSEFPDWPIGDARALGVLTNSDSGSISGWIDSDTFQATGAWDLEWDYSGKPGAEFGPVSGTGRLVGDHGSWVGTWGGVMYRDRFCSSGRYVGDGEYAGLTLYVQATFMNGTGTFSGLIDETEYSAGGPT